MPAAIVVLAAPGGGDGVVAQALARAAGVRVVAGDPYPEAVRSLRAGSGRLTHRLTAEDLRPRGVRRAVVDAAGDAPGRPLLSGLRLALRVPLIATALPDARFVLVERDLRTALALALDGWASQDVVSVPDLPGWDGPPWSLPLVPGWRALSGRPLGEIVGGQWREVAETVLDDLETLPPERWSVLDRDRLLNDPGPELRRLCTFLDLRYDQALRTPVEAARRSTALRPPPRATPDLAAAVAIAAPAARRLRELIAAPAAPPVRGGSAAPTATLSSRSTAGLARTLHGLGRSLVLTSRQAGMVAVVRVREGRVNTHVRRFDGPAAVVAQRDRLVLGARAGVWELRDTPAASAADEDACYVPRRLHLTGTAGIADFALAGDELWLASAELSCLATFDADHSLVPRWTPPFVDRASPGDACHLSGVAVRDGRPATVTAYGATDTPGGWRAAAATGGVVLDVGTREVVAAGLALPCAPRWHGDRLLALEAGRGELVQLDAATGGRTVIRALPGVPRALAIDGDTAFVALAQARDPGGLGDLPVLRRLADRLSGVWAIDLRTGAVAGLLRFDDAVHDCDGVAVLDRRWPELVEPDSATAERTLALP